MSSLTEVSKTTQGINLFFHVYKVQISIQIAIIQDKDFNGCKTNM